MTIRPARPDDLPALETLIVPFVADGRILPRTADELTDLLPNGFVAVHDESLVGFATLEVYSKKLAELRSLVVAESLQGQGVGSLLVEACLQRAHELHIFEVLVISSQESFFRTCGFDFTLPGEKKALFYQTRTDP